VLFFDLFRLGKNAILEFFAINFDELLASVIFEVNFFEVYWAFPL